MLVEGGLILSEKDYKHPRSYHKAVTCCCKKWLYRNMTGSCIGRMLCCKNSHCSNIHFAEHWQSLWGRPRADRGCTTGESQCEALKVGAAVGTATELRRHRTIHICLKGGSWTAFWKIKENLVKVEWSEGEKHLCHWNLRAPQGVTPN